MITNKVKNQGLATLLLGRGIEKPLLSFRGDSKGSMRDAKDLQPLIPCGVLQEISR